MSGERRPACWRCRFFDRDSDSDEDGGFCRRYPPVSADSGNRCMWPGIEYMDWCGEFEEEDE